MNVFLAGATGAIGQPIVTHLLAAGHQVFAMTQSVEKGRALSRQGAHPIVADVLNRGAVIDAVANVAPEVVINMLTSLPKNYTPEAMREAAKRNAQVRIEGGANLRAAAKKSGARRYIMQSASFWYAPGKGLADEEMPFAFEATPAIAAGTRTYEELEKSALEDPDFDGVSLRFGFFYGPGTWFAPDGDIADQVRGERLPIVGEGEGVWSFIHVEDAAEAIEASLDCPAGIYNINDDTPSEMKNWLPKYARCLGAPSPPRVSEDQGVKQKGADFVYYATRLRGASNKKAKRVLGIVPRPLEWMN